MKRANIFDPIQKELDQKVFNGIDPRPRIIKFISDEMQKVLIPLIGFDPLEFMDLYLTGSLTTYQYGETSDCDISVFVQWDQWPTGEDPNTIRRRLIPIIMNKLDGTLLPATSHPIQHFIVPPGVEPDDLYKPGLRSAWSFRDSKWLVPPEKDRVHDISVELPVLYHRAEMMADKMNILLETNPIYAKEFWHQIHRKRQMDQQKGLGDFSEGNIVYKYLLHNGYFDRIRDELGEKISKLAAETDLGFGTAPGENYMPPIGSVWTMSNPFAGATPATRDQPKRQTIQVIDTDNRMVWYKDLDRQQGLDSADGMSLNRWNDLMYRQILRMRNQEWHLQESPEQAADLWPDTLPPNWSMVREAGEFDIPNYARMVFLFEPDGRIEIGDPDLHSDHENLSGELGREFNKRFEMRFPSDEALDEYWHSHGPYQGEVNIYGKDYRINDENSEVGITAEQRQKIDQAVQAYLERKQSSWKMADTQRLFLAYELPEQIVAQVIQWQEQNLPEGVHPEPATNLHMTIAFLGDTDTSMIPGLQQILGEIDPTQVSLSGPIEYRELEKLAFLALQDNGGNEVVEQINEKLNALMGYEPQFKPWLPHITVWRFAPENKPNLQPQLPNFGAFTPLGVHVYTSVKNPVGGGTYQKVAATQTMYHVSPDGGHETSGFTDPRGVYLFDNVDEAISFGNGWLEKHPEKHLYQVEADPNQLGPDQEWEALEEEENPHAFYYEGAIPPENVRLLDSKKRPDYWTRKDYERLSEGYARPELPAPDWQIGKTADDLSWVDKSTPYGTPDGGFIGGPDHPGDDPIGDQPTSVPPRDDQSPSRHSLKIIYDFDRDQIILGDKATAEQFPPGQIIGEYRAPDVYLTDHAEAWFNPKYFKKLWLHSFPKREIRHVILDRGHGSQEVVHRAPESAILEDHEAHQDTQAQLEATEHEAHGQEAPAPVRQAQEHVAYRWPDWDDIDFLSHEAVDNHQGYRDQEGLMGAVGNVQLANMYGQHQDIFDVAADLLYKIQRQQAAVEGNKRTAASVALHFLEEHGVDTQPLDTHFEALADIIANLDRGTTMEQLAAFFREHLTHGGT